MMMMMMMCPWKPQKGSENWYARVGAESKSFDFILLRCELRFCADLLAKQWKDSRGPKIAKGQHKTVAAAATPTTPPSWDIFLGWLGC